MSRGWSKQRKSYRCPLFLIFKGNNRFVISKRIQSLLKWGIYNFFNLKLKKKTKLNGFKTLFFIFRLRLTAAGSWFALAQSVGVVGTAASTKGAIGAVTGAITYAVTSVFSNCEAE